MLHSLVLSRALALVWSSFGKPWSADEHTGYEDRIAREPCMNAPSLTPEQHDELVDALAEALEEMIDQSCPDMGPLWVEATRAERAYLGESALSELGFRPSPRYMSLSKGARSRYRGLAAWRHAVVWRRIQPRIEDPDFRAALRAVYFTPFPDNAPPYAWSSRASDAPDVESFESPTTLKHHAKEGCWHTLRLLSAERDTLKARGDWLSELCALLLRPAVRDSNRELLKLEDHPPLEKDR